MKISLIGTGLIGKPLANRLFECGYNVCVYNRTKEKTLELEQVGIKVSNSLEELFDFSDIILLTLTDYNSIKDVFSNYSFSTKKDVIQMGTISTQQNIELEKYFNAINCNYMEAPILGSKNESRTGTLLIFFGGSTNNFLKHEKLLKDMAKKVYYIGEVGSASTIKLALNNMIAGMFSTFSTSLKMVKNSNLNTDIFMEILRESSLYAPTFDKKIKNILTKDYSNPNFPLKHLLKDVELIKETSNNLSINTGIINSIIGLILTGLENGYAEEDYSSLYESI
ncbi:MAG: NAD(P)-dependent oxidoreductase [Candidatus Sericytochromatia bacterium]